MILALLKKDWRVNLITTVGGFILISVLYANLLFVIFLSRLFPGYMNILGSMQVQATIGTLVVLMLAAAYGGAAFASERRERSSNWLNMLPVTRGQIILSKLAMAGMCLTGLLVYCWIGPLIIELELGLQFWHPSSAIRELLTLFITGLAWTWMLFSVAWLCSTFLESAAISAAISIATTIASAVILFSICDWLRIRGDTPQVIVVCWMLLAGTVSFVVGTRYYLRRVEP